MLGSVDFLLEPRALASVWHLDRSLQDDRPRVDAFVHEVNRDAGDLHAMLERLADCIETRERRQECRVDVDDPVPESLDELSAQELHVSREHDQVDVTLGQPVPIAASRASRSRCSERGKTAVSTPAFRARSSAFVWGLFETTAAISIPSRSWSRSRIACRFVPVPETRTATRDPLTQRAAQRRRLPPVPVRTCRLPRRRPRAGTRP